MLKLITELQLSYEPFGETCKKTKKIASYTYSLFTPVTFAPGAHTESQSTGIGLTTLGRRRICCVYFVPSFACIRLYH